MKGRVFLEKLCVSLAQQNSLTYNEYLSQVKSVGFGGKFSCINTRPYTCKVATLLF